MRDLGHGPPATPALPFRNVTLDFFEAIITTPQNTNVIPQLNLSLQQSGGNYYY